MQRCISEVHISAIFTADAFHFLASDWWRKVMHSNEWHITSYYPCFFLRFTNIHMVKVRAFKER